MFSTAIKATIASILLIGFTAGQQVLPVYAQAFDMADESAVWIEGTSTVNSFVCSTDDVKGTGVLSGTGAHVAPDTSGAHDAVTEQQKPAEGVDPEDHVPARQVADREEESGAAETDAEASQVVVHVPAARLDCGLPAMNKDLRESLKVDTQPTIDFRLDRTEVLALPEQNNGLFLIRAHGWLSLAGNERQVDVLLEGERTETGSLRGWGSKDLKMSDFGIKPPSALFGLVRAHDDITVRFNFIAEPTSTASKQR